jgi:hypothetical protein
MRSFSVLLGTFLAATFAAFAATPIANVISADTVAVDGINAPARNYIPVQAGDVVSSKSAAAIVRYTDGTTVILQPNSRVKVDTHAGNPDFRVLSGAAQYKLTLNSKARVTNGSDALIEKLYDDVTAGRAVPSALPAAVLYAAPSSKSSAVILPAAPISTGGFLTANPGTGGSGILTGKLVPNANTPGGGGGPSISLPTGLTLNLTATTDLNTGTVSYIVASISQPVTLPNGSVATIVISSTGTTTFDSSGNQTSSTTTTNTSTLLGATLGGTTDPTGDPTKVAISLTPTGSTTPLTPTQVTNSLATVTSTAVTTAVNNGALPANTAPPAIGPVSIGTFSTGS